MISAHGLKALTIDLDGSVIMTAQPVDGAPIEVQTTIERLTEWVDYLNKMHGDMREIANRT